LVRARRNRHTDAHVPGCLLEGHLLVNRVPGNFHIEARSKYHNLNPPLTNVSHVVHELTFGPPITKEYRRKLEVSNRLITQHFWRETFTTSFQMANSYSRKSSVSLNRL
jgi:hypothetical protein